MLAHEPRQTDETRLATIEEETPSAILRRATDAAKQLQAVVANTRKKLVINGKQYLFFEDWQTLGRFNNITAKVERTEELREDGKLIGFKSRAIAIQHGEEISAAEAECTFDEENWKDKPRARLLSMAQTRACSKALRNCLAWIAVLAGYEPTPAEELDEEPREAPAQEENTQEPAENTAPAQNRGTITEPQRRKIYHDAREKGVTDERIKTYINSRWGKTNLNELTKLEASQLIDAMGQIGAK